MRLLFVAVLLLACAGCQPTFESEGTLTVGGTTFRPVACHVLAPRATGVALNDSEGRSLELTLPPAILDAWRELRGTPSTALTLPGQPPTDLGPCGLLTLEGEGYHGQGKRAASGTASLDCAVGAAAVQGTLTFSGCF